VGVSYLQSFSVDAAPTTTPYQVFFYLLSNYFFIYSFSSHHLFRKGGAKISPVEKSFNLLLLAATQLSWVRFF
jgi:hypothetical protein